MSEIQEATRLSLRDYFAAQAMATQFTRFGLRPDEISKRAYQVADAMLKAREGVEDESETTV